MAFRSKFTGKVLRLKNGYNPNSSSVGSDIPTFLAIATGAAAAVTMAVHLLSAAADRIRGNKADSANPEDKAE